MKKILACLILILLNPCFGDPSSLPLNALLNPNLQDSFYIDEEMRHIMAPYLLPLDHPYKATLDLIFSASRVTENRQTLEQAGFVVIAPMATSFATVAKHPAIPGYVFKLYLDSEVRTRKGKTGCVLLTERCIGAEHIRRIITKKKMRYFTVPNKWLYVLPVYPLSTEVNPQPVILIATDMELAGAQISKEAWQKVGRKELDELYAILKHGYGSVRVVGNIPYTKHGTFAFTDTEHLKRNLQLSIVNKYLSKEIQYYWNKLIDEN